MWRYASAFLILVSLSAPPPAGAIMSGEESKLAPSGDADNAAGRAAFLARDWPKTVASLTMVLVRRPWHDNAHAMLGYAFRELHDHDHAFYHYGVALELNPRHRGALSYLGVLYLELDRVDEARATALRLGEECSLVVMAFDNTGWKSGCEELNELIAAFARRGIAVRAQDR